MRSPIVIMLVAVILASVIMTIPGADATPRPDDTPTELSELCYWNGVDATVYYAYPDKPIGAEHIPPLPTGCVCWVREDTREVVTADTVFKPGSYLISPYSWVPEPWDASSGSSAGSVNTLSVIAIVLSSVAIITSGVAIVMMIRRK